MNQVRLSAQQWPGESRSERMAHAPAGWVYNPSSWAQRVPLVILAFVGFVIAGWLALYQLGVAPEIPEPFFGAGSRHILNSGISHALPVPDAALGAFGYLIDAVFGLLGGNERWKRLPWVVIIFAIAVIPFGATSILLFILQPTVFDSWCTLCLISVAISLAMVPYAWDEFVASWHWVRGRMDAGMSFRAALAGR